MDEIKNAVPAGIHASNQIRPRHRTLRRNAGGQFAEISLRRQFGEVRHLAFAHKLAQ